MALEKIAKYAKTILTDKVTIATYALAGTSTGLIIFDGKINPMDVITLLIAGIGTAFATAGSAVSYQNVEEICERDGFTERIMKDKNRRREARIYARYNRRIDEFDIASKRYSV
ncbi:MAG: hypothetical protein Q8N63_02055 [Nanoarchaeota archaeon]|nr:hypothetical protein [Nanoarchaeota archaeon]